MRRWSQAVEQSWVTSGQGEEIIWWPIEDSTAKTKCPKMWLLSFDLFDLCHPLDLWTHPSPASAHLDNTPSIWRWRTTHTCTIKQLLSGKELSSVSCGSKTPLFFSFVFLCVWTFVCLFFTPGCSFFAKHCVHQSWVERSREGGLAWGSECDISVMGLWPTSLKYTCMQTSIHTRAGEKCMGYKGVNSSSSFKNTLILIGWKKK